MPLPSDPSARDDAFQSLPDETWRRLERILERFEDAWNRGERPALEEFLAEAEPAARPALLVELVQEDLEYRLKAGEAGRVEDYLRRFPELDQMGDAMIALIAAEHRHCAQLGRPISLDDYLRRFPHWRTELANRLGPSSGDTEGSRAEVLANVAANGVTSDSAALHFLSPAQQPDEIGRFGLYRILKVLGRGGMGLVLQAEDTVLKRPVALKVMRPEMAHQPGARKRFLREAQLAAAIQHDHIVTIHHVGEIAGVPFLTMPCLEGMSLEELLRRTGPLPVAEVLRLGRHIALGLAAAHARGLIHRDVKPANLWIEPEQGGRIKILDFGLARPVTADVHLTQTGTFLGTPAYMAPEQARGEKVDSRCDLFSLGVVLYRMCTGQMPYRADNVATLLMSLATDTPAAPNTINTAVPPALADLILALLAKDAQRRPAAAADVARRLEQLAREHTDTAAVATSRESAAAPTPAAWAAATASLSVVGPAKAIPSPGLSHRHRRRWLAAGAGVVLLLALAYPVYRWSGLFSGTRIDEPNDQVQRPQSAAASQGPGGKAPKQHTKQRHPAVGAGPVVAVKGPGAQARADENNAVDQQAADWVRSVGGVVTIHNDKGDLQVKRTDKLPAGPFQVVVVHLSDQQISDGDLIHVKGLTNLWALGLRKTPLKGAGLVHLKGLLKLQVLDLGFTQVSDASLIHLQGLSGLQTLDLYATPVTNAGLENLYPLKNLQILYVSKTKVTAAGIAKFQKVLPQCQVVP